MQVITCVVCRRNLSPKERQSDYGLCNSCWDSLKCQKCAQPLKRREKETKTGLCTYCCGTLSTGALRILYFENGSWRQQSQASRSSNDKGGHPPPQSGEEFSFLQYNIMLDSYYSPERVRGLAELVFKKQPDLILLQEVTCELRHLILDCHVFQDYWISYKHFEPSGDNPRMHGLMTLTKFKPTTVQILKLPSNRKRKSIVIYTQLSNGETLAIANFHLESPIEDAVIRASQVQVIQQATVQSKFVLLGGDSNMMTNKENDCLDDRNKDMFLVLKELGEIDNYDMGE